MSIRNIFRKKSEDFDCFSSIKELPVETWFDIHETGDLLLLFKDRKKAFLTPKLNTLFDEIYNSFINTFGLSDEYLLDIENERQMAIMKADLIITGKKHLKTLIEIRKLRKSPISKPVELGKILAQLGKYYGYFLNEKISVYQYYSHLNAIKKNG